MTLSEAMEQFGVTERKERDIDNDNKMDIRTKFAAIARAKTASAHAANVVVKILAKSA